MKYTEADDKIIRTTAYKYKRNKNKYRDYDKRIKPVVKKEKSPDLRYVRKASDYIPDEDEYTNEDTNDE